MAAEPPTSAGRRISIRTKLVLALVVPLLAVVTVSVGQVTKARADVKRVERETDLAAITLGPGGLIRALSNEQIDSSTAMFGFTAPASITPTIEDANRLVDRNRAELAQQLTSATPQVRALFAPALARIDAELPKLRARLADQKVRSLQQIDDAVALYNAYTPLVEGLIEVNQQLAGQITDRQLRQDVDALNTTTGQIFELATMGWTASNYFLLGLGDQASRDAAVATIERFDLGRRQLSQITTGPLAPKVKDLMANPDYGQVRGEIDTLLAGGRFDVSSMIATLTETKGYSYEQLLGDAGTALKARSNTLLRDAQQRERDYLLGALAVILGGLVIAVLAARSITRPLRSLTQQATDMADDRLPAAVKQVLDTPLGEDVQVPDVAPIEVKTRDEVQDVAGALNKVQGAAVDLAVEQALLRRNVSDSFLNLGQRTQDLISRQLDLISELERDEADPDALDKLFALDHLATRARRNAESLVLLGGVAAPRQFADPIAVRDVVRGAIGEVADYQRVEIGQVDGGAIDGGLATDLVHLLAELLENGLTFSPDTARVLVTGVRSGEGYRLAVTDHGSGMTREQLDLANRRLSGAESFTVAPSHYLGHYVAGHLAERIGARVRVDRTRAGGIQASVDLPASVLVQAAPRPAPTPPPTPPSPTAGGQPEAQTIQLPTRLKVVEPPIEHVPDHPADSEPTPA